MATYSESNNFGLGLRDRIENLVENEGLSQAWRNLTAGHSEFEVFKPESHNGCSKKAMSWPIWSNIDPPVHSILVMVVGTRGDVDPLMSLSLKLKERKHQILFATHAAYRREVFRKGLDFFPLAGDPEILSGFAVKWSSASTTLRESYEILQSHSDGVKELLHSTWAVICETGFVPDCIISNPVTFTHAHIAESCGSSLHIAFPQPWVPTDKFPHPMFSSKRYPHQFLGLYDEKKVNVLSYQLADRMLYLGTETSIDELRKLMNLRPTSVGEGHWKVLPAKKVPFSLLLSDTLLSRPDDWKEHVEICGSVRETMMDAKKEDAESVREIPESLRSFLGAGGSPVYIGFGSMVFQGLSSLEHIIGSLLEAAAINNVRVLVQLQRWSHFSAEHFKSLATKARKTALMIKQVDQHLYHNEVWFDYIVQRAVHAILSTDSNNAMTSAEEVYPTVSEHQEHRQEWTENDAAVLFGDCSHKELFRHMIAVVHHGGAGTTFEGLRHGLPTWVLPFFGDQRMWGEAIHAKGAGPQPVAASNVNISICVDAISMLLSKDCKQAALSLQDSIKNEDGAARAASHVLESLPLHTSLCTLSLLMGRVRLAEVFCAICDLNMTCEAFERSHEGDENLLWHTPSPVTYFDWSPRNPKTVIKGLGVGAAGLVRCLAGGVYGSLANPTIGAMEGGLYGALRGMVKGCSSLIDSTQEGGALLASKVQVGATDNTKRLTFCFTSNGEGSKMKFHRVLGTRCCEEQKEGRVFSKGRAAPQPKENALMIRTLEFKTALSVAKILQKFMIYIRSKNHVKIYDPVFDHCLHGDELKAELRSQSALRTEESWSPLFACSSGELLPCFDPCQSSEYVMIEEQSFMGKTKDKVYLNDLALFIRRVPPTTF